MTTEIRQHLRAMEPEIARAFSESWMVGGVAGFCVTSQNGERRGVRVGRAAVLLEPDGRVFTTDLMRVSPSGNMTTAVHEAKWGAAGGGVLNEHSPTGTPSPLDHDGMAAARDGWADMLALVRARLEMRERAGVRTGALYEVETVSAVFGRAPPRRTELRPETAILLREVLTECFVGEVRHALEEWRGALDPRLRAAAETCRINSPAEFNWLAHDLRGTGPPVRLQAVEAHPWAMHMMRESPRVFAVVESRRPLNAVIAAELGVSEAAIARVRGMPPSGNPSDTGLVLGLAARPDVRTPRTLPGWRALHAALVTLPGLPAEASGETSERWLAAGGPEWDAMTVAETAALIDLPAALRDLTRHLGRVVAWRFGRRFGLDAWSDVLRPTLLESPRASAGRLMMWRSECLNAGMQLRADFPLLDGGGDGSWLPLHPPFDAGYGLTVVALNDVQALREEHIRMGHCVDQYVGNCMVSGSHILSFRDVTGRSVATAEYRQNALLAIAGSKGDFVPPSMQLSPGCVQYKGPKNSVPSPQAFMALWGHYAAIVSGRLPLNAQVLRDGLAERIHQRSAHQGGTVAAGDAGYDVRVPGALRSALRAYSAVLPKSVRKLLEGYVRTEEAQAVVNVVPDTRRGPAA